jgi:hypothetical protein
LILSPSLTPRVGVMYGDMRPVSEPQLRVQVVDDEIIVSLPGYSYSVTYYKPANQPQLIARRISDRDDLRIEMKLSEFLRQRQGERALSNASAAWRAALSSKLPGGGSFVIGRGFAAVSLTLPTGRSFGSLACSVNAPFDPTGRLRTTPGLAKGHWFASQNLA